MADLIRMQRFPDDEDRGRQGAFTPEAKAYGPGAFSWDTDGHGVRFLIFRRPDRVFQDSDGNPVGISAVPVYRAGEERLPSPYANQWEWDGDEDSPTLTPSIRNTTWPSNQPNEVETFHGFVRGGMIEVL